MLKALVLIALIYVFVRMFLNYKASLSTTKTWKQNNHCFISDNKDIFNPNDNSDLFTQNDNSFGYHQRHQGIEINPATGLPMMGDIDVCGNPYGFDMHHCGSTHDLSSHASSFRGFSHDD
ncbi:hypothetical protein [Sulfuricurvum sp.]|uniref:hypothetical protein n=1 Tax=Sulfuricurvum sp. TaxID=2025608 RepID=UPI00262DE06B|nr:hypothetical protein [Sulfuricurvum sp.]MDD3595606.1 hypothetical protein [Sulfuricurvum sp.]